MLIFGYICLLCITIYVAVGTYGVVWMSVGFTGKLGIEAYFFIALFLSLVA